MSKHNRPFKFKQFEVSHHRSSMKVGVDAVILGAWVDVRNVRKVIDVGCGCGVISLIIAQRSLNAEIEGIDIDAESIGEANENFRASQWSGRLRATLIDFSQFCNTQEPESVDYIVSNPPYFDSGVASPETIREKARHQGELSPEVILDRGYGLLRASGVIGLVIPFDQTEGLINHADSIGLKPIRTLIMSGRTGRTPKRTFIEFAKQLDVAGSVEQITLEDVNGDYTPEYRDLCRDLYLKF